MKRLACLALALLLAGPAVAQPLEQKEKKAVVLRAGQLLAEQYIYPQRARAARDKINQDMAAGAYDAIDDPAVFAKRLTEDFRNVMHDKHIFISAETVPTPPDPAAPAPPPTDGGFARVDRLQGNIGYIKLNSFPMPEVFKPAADAAMRDIAGTDALIIDMRDNGGGSAESDAYFGSFFFDRSWQVQLNAVVHRVPGTARFTTRRFWTSRVPAPYLDKPVYLLTSARTFSAGEAFVYDLQARKRAAVYGEVTGGGANPGGGQVLNARFNIFIPTGRAENPVTGTNWEGTGVAPDRPMDEKLAFQAALRDIASKRGLDDIKTRLAAETGPDPFVEAHLLKIRTVPLPGSEAAVRRNIEDIVQGTPNYRLMSEDLADTTKAQLPRLQDMLTRLGPIRAITFRYIDPAGRDVFDVTMANGAVQSGIFVAQGGKIETVWIHPVTQ